MKACFVFTVILIGAVAASSAMEIGIGESEPSHTVMKRETIQGPAWPHPCVFYECIASCRQRGYKSGGYCTINGCQCLR